MAKKHWIYSNTNSSSHGLMECCSCKKKIVSGDYRYYDAGEAYVCQCYRCGKNDQKWLDKIREDKRIEEEEAAERMRSTPGVLLHRIKDAFFEGWGSYATPASSYNTPDEAWEESETKQVYDSLKEYWGL